MQLTAIPRLLLFSTILAVVFGVAALAGSAIDPSDVDAEGGGEVHGGEHSEGAGGGDAHDGGSGAPPPPGVQVAQDEHRLAAARTRFPRGSGYQPFSFRIVDERGGAVRDFEPAHERRMHFIVVRRDLDGFQHLHPTMSRDGTWRTRVDFGRPGTYRAFADFTRAGEQRTLGADVHVGGSFTPRSLPAPARTVRTDGGLEVTLRAGETQVGKAGRVAFSVRDGDRVVNDEVQPYLGAKGHLVALREGDLAYLHTHPEDDELAFMTEYPSAGAYRLFVQFRYGGRVHTAAFTRRVSE